MTANEYLKKVLARETLDEDGDELKDLRARRKDVDKLLLENFSDAAPTIRYGGSKAKGTMIKAAYDLDIICYFPNDSSLAGSTLEEIHTNVKRALEAKYFVESKASALRLKGKGAEDYKQDFHIDVIPGRFVDDTKSDAFLFQPSGEKKRLKTNLQVHIDHVRDSGVRDAIRLMKLWRSRNGIQFKSFVLELLVIELLKDKVSNGLSDQLIEVWTQFRDKSQELSVQDPANPTGNDLSGDLNSVRTLLSIIAGGTLSAIENGGWESVFGKVDDDEGKGGTLEVLERAAAVITRPSKPWRDKP